MSTRFEISNTPFSGLKVLLRNPIGDHRGYLERIYCTRDLAELLNGRSISQINHTSSALRGTVRGMHFQQNPHAEMKFVSCLQGEVFDVAVDIRPESPTYLRYYAEILSGNNFKTLAIPEGFAHGFQTLTDYCEMLYLHTAPYVPSAEKGLNPSDPMLKIPWPLAIKEISAKDASHPMLMPS